MKRLWSLLLAVCVLVSTLSVVGPPVSAAEKETTKRSIAIVYDNSGSMYFDDAGVEDEKDFKKLKAWCQALYAVEVFASMMNENDELWVYPMHEIKSGKKTYSEDSPLKISDPKDAKMIRDIETMEATGTPPSTIKKAYDDLKKKKGEKWLIVLTDGVQFDGLSDSKKELSDMINPYVEDVNVIFLGIGKEAVQPSLKDKGGHRAIVDKADQSSDVLSKLTKICNLIFNRDAMEVSNNTLDFDVSMKRLILFVQGTNISNVSLSGDAGKRGDEFAPHFSEHNKTKIYTGNEFEGAIDEDLQGVITNYYDVPSGQYTLNYDGTMSITGAYYEPDVDLTVRLVDENGNEVKKEDTVPPGKYKIVYGLVDAQTGEYTDSKWLGDTHYDITYTINDEPYTVETDQKSGEIEIEVGPDSKLWLEDIHVQYLSGYEIHKNGLDFDWPKGGFNIDFMPAGDFSINISGGPEGGLYKLADGGAAPFTATFNYDGRQLTAEEIANITDFKVEADGSDMEFEAVPEGDHYNITPLFPEDPEKIDETQIQGKVEATYAEPNHDPAEAEAGFGFQIEIPAKEFTIELTGGAEDGKYKLSELENEAPFVATFLYGGEKMDEDEVAAIDFKIDVGEFNIDFDTMQEGDHINIYPRYPDPKKPENTAIDDIVSKALATYTAPGHGEANAEAEIKLNIENDVTGLSAKLDKSKERFTLAELNGYSLDLDLLMGGEPLTEEQINNLEVEVAIADKKGRSIPCTVEKDAAGSKAHLVFSNDGVKTGKYKLEVKATTLNELGESTSSTDHMRFKVALLPVWVIMTAIFIVLALITLLLWFILSRKVLPKKVIISNTRYMVDGEPNPGDATPVFKGARKKVGTIQITPPRAVMYPGVRANYTIHVAASDTRFKVLKKKLTGKGNLTVMCTGIDARNNINRVMLSGTAYNWDDNHNLRLPPGEETIPPFRVANEDTSIMNATAVSGGNEVALTMSCTLNFK